MKKTNRESKVYCDKLGIDVPYSVCEKCPVVTRALESNGRDWDRKVCNLMIKEAKEALYDLGGYLDREKVKKDLADGKLIETPPLGDEPL